MRMTPFPPRGSPLQRTFTNFPSGPVGAALFFLRVVVGASAIAEAALSVAANHSPIRCAAAIPAALAGLALLPGWLVPLASALLAVEGAAILIFTHAGVLTLLESYMALFEFIVMATTLAVLGPGAASVDARRFGRREVEIA
jgi:uncharacterized membrane protein YphA (DoxX/SURF4 family)